METDTKKQAHTEQGHGTQNTRSTQGEKVQTGTDQGTDPETAGLTLYTRIREATSNRLGHEPTQPRRPSQEALGRWTVAGDRGLGHRVYQSGNRNKQPGVR